MDDNVDDDMDDDMNDEMDDDVDNYNAHFDEYVDITNEDEAIDLQSHNEPDLHLSINEETRKDDNSRHAENETATSNLTNAIDQQDKVQRQLDTIRNSKVNTWHIDIPKCCN